MSKKSVVAKYRSDFGLGLSGCWYSRLGGGEEMLHGIAIEFDEDGTGKVTQWDCLLGVGPTGESQTEEPFRWETVGERSIRLIANNGDESVVSYDFKARKDEYGTIVVLLYEPDHESREFLGEEGFWVSAYPLAFRAS